MWEKESGEEIGESRDQCGRCKAKSENTQGCLAVLLAEFFGLNRFRFSEGACDVEGTDEAIVNTKMEVGLEKSKGGDHGGNENEKTIEWMKSETGECRPCEYGERYSYPGAGFAEGDFAFADVAGSGNVLIGL